MRITHLRLVAAVLGAGLALATPAVAATSTSPSGSASSSSAPSKSATPTPSRTPSKSATPTPSTTSSKSPTPTKSPSSSAASGSVTFLGDISKCTTTSGALVAVDFAHWSGPKVRGCDPNPTTGINLLTTGGFTTAGDQHDGPQFICRIGAALYNSGTQYPTPAQDPCIVTPPASAYWSYWVAAKGNNTWTYSSLGAYSHQATAGEVEAWTFGGTDVSGTTGQPSFTPNDVRSGLATSVKSRALAVLKPAATSPNIGAASAYLVKNLVDGSYYEPFGGGFADFGLTMDGALALAASGDQDTAYRDILTFLDDRGKDPSGRTVDDYTGIGTQDAQAGAIGKEALLAEVAGYDPHDFGGHDLIKALDGLVCTKSSDACAGAGNYSYAQSTFSQTLAIMAQLRAGDTAGAAAPIAYLEGTQHGSGAFPSVIAGGDSDTDSTGMAAMALALVPGETARAALNKALAWLAGKQEGDGGFPGASGDSVNSAAITLQALRLDAAKYQKQIAKGEKFLAAEQLSDGGFAIAAGLEGDGSDVRASTQALGGAIGTPFGSLLRSLPALADAASGADYLVSQLVDGNHYATTYDGQEYPSYGETADGALSLLAVGGHATTVGAMVNWLEGQVEAYGDPGATAGGPYSGGLAKLALVAEATGQDPHDFGGTDLLGVIEKNVCAAAIAGDYSPCTAAGDVYNAFSGVSQALAVLALGASHDARDHLSTSSPVVVRLHELQCADGGFSSTLITAGQTCVSDVDTTGYAVQALATVPGTSTWLAAAQAYLTKVQDSSGLFSGASGLNANSTELAAQALQTLTAALWRVPGAEARPAGAAKLAAATAAVPAAVTPAFGLAPITAWQSALIGLQTLSVSGGGFGVSSPSAADPLASSQTVAAAAQQTLVSLVGAVIRSVPSLPVVSPPSGGGSSAPTSGPNNATATVPGGAARSAAASSATAETGVSALQQLTWALALVAVGGAVAFAGRRRVAVAIGRHRTGGPTVRRRRH